MSRRAVAGACGVLLLFLALALLAPLLLSFVAPPDRGPAGSERPSAAPERWGFLIAATLAAGVGAGLRWIGREKLEAELGLRESYGVVTLGWILAAAVGAIPFMVAGGLSFTDAFFETMSGFTTTGSSVYGDPGVLSPALLFWRSFTQWIGGLGIVVLCVAVLPALGAQGSALFRVERGDAGERLRPRIADTARLLLVIYGVITSVFVLLFVLGGMGTVDAVCHAFAGISTGGFSTRFDSYASFSPFLQWTTTLLMIVGGTSFALLYAAFVGGRWRRLVQDPEFRFYVGMLGTATLLITAVLLVGGAGEASPRGYTLWEALRHAAFQASTVLTTCGFASADFALWPAFTQVLLFVLMFPGACVGSTSGAAKSVRVLIASKVAFRDMKLHLSPRAVFPIRLGNETLDRDTVSSVLGFLLLYMSCFLIGSAVVALAGPATPWEAMSASAACLGNVGPGFGELGPMSCFAKLSDVATWSLSFEMLLGRLEIYSVLLLFFPSAWRK